MRVSTVPVITLNSTTTGPLHGSCSGVEGWHNTGETKMSAVTSSLDDGLVLSNSSNQLLTTTSCSVSKTTDDLVPYITSVDDKWMMVRSGDKWVWMQRPRCASENNADDSDAEVSNEIKEALFTMDGVGPKSSANFGPPPSPSQMDDDDVVNVNNDIRDFVIKACCWAKGVNALTFNVHEGVPHSYLHVLAVLFAIFIVFNVLLLVADLLSVGGVHLFVLNCRFWFRYVVLTCIVMYVCTFIYTYPRTDWDDILFTLVLVGVSGVAMLLIHLICVMLCYAINKLI